MDIYEEYVLNTDTVCAQMRLKRGEMDEILRDMENCHF